MPFTPSHAVVALPFVRTPLLPAAVAVGAMTPDLPLFTRNLPLPYTRTHDPAWLAVTVVLALVLLLVWRSALRPAVRELAPRWLARRLPPEWDAGATAGVRETLGLRPAGETPRVSWRGLGLLAVSLAIGVLTHIVWDLFTHEGRAGVEVLPALGEAWGPLLGYKWLQHGSSALGLAVVGVWMLVWLIRRDPADDVPRVTPPWVRRVWWFSLPAVLVSAWLIGLAVYGPLDAEFTLAHLAYRVLPVATGLWGLATVLLCGVVQLRRTAQTDRARSSAGSAAS